MNHKNTLAVVSAIIALCASVHAESLSTTDGATYDNITSQRVDPDGLYIEYALPGGGLGMSKVKFSRLSPEQQKQFGYDANKAREFEAQNTKAMEDWRTETVRREQEARAVKAEQAAQANQAETIKTDRILAMAQLKQAEADLARSTGGEGYGGSYGYGGDYGYAIPQTGRVTPAKRQFAPIVTPVPFPRLNTPTHSR